MSFIYAGCISVVALAVRGILAATEELINDMRNRAVVIPQPVPVLRPHAGERLPKPVETT